jgi:argininosuccinate lyase
MDMNDSEGPVHEAGYEAFDTAARVLDLLDALMAVVGIDHERVRRHIDESCATITELADSLVRHEEIAFRQAHEIAARLARHTITQDISLAALPMAAFTEAFAGTIGRAPKITETELRAICTQENFVMVRDMFGGPARMCESLETYKFELLAQEQLAAAHRARIDRAVRLRAAASS